MAVCGNIVDEKIEFLGQTSLFVRKVLLERGLCNRRSILPGGKQVSEGFVEPVDAAFYLVELVKFIGVAGWIFLLLDSTLL